MINIDFSPNSIQDIFTSAEQVSSYADDIDRLSLPNHEDIDRELNSAKKDIDSYAKSIEQEAKEIKSNISNVLDKDFEYKFELFVQLVDKGLTDESFPITEWITEKQKLDESFSVRNFESLKNAIKNCENEDNKNNLEVEYLSIIEKYLNSPISFKHMSGKSFIKDCNDFIQENNKDCDNIYQNFKQFTYTKETGNSTVCSQANFWQTYHTMINIEDSLSQTITFLKQIPDNKIEDFVSFLSRTDFLFKRNHRNSIESFKKENLRNIIGVLHDQNIRENFLPGFINALNKVKENSYLKNEDKDMFEFVLKELEKTGQYLTLNNKFINKEEKTKTRKI